MKFNCNNDTEIIIIIFGITITCNPKSLNIYTTIKYISIKYAHNHKMEV